MSPKALFALLLGIALLFAGVWGGGWYALTASRQRAKDEATAAEQAKLDAERKQRQAAEQARAEEEEKQRREEAAAKAEAKSKAANKAAKAKADRKREDDRQRRIDLLTGVDRIYYQQFASMLSKRPIKDTPMEWDPNAIIFLIGHADLFPEGLAAKRLGELADDHGAGKFIADQEIEPLAQPRCKLALIQLRADIQDFAVKLLDRARANGIASLSDFDKNFIKDNPALFPKYNR